MKLDNKKYKQCILEKANLPKRENNYEGLENCLESLFGLKVCFCIEFVEEMFTLNTFGNLAL